MFTQEAMQGYAVAAVFTIINLLVSYFVLKRFLFKPLLKLLRKRREDVGKELSQAEEKLTDAESKLADATLRLDRSSHEAAEIVTTARSQAEVQGEAILSNARNEATGMITRAEGEISRMRVTMLNDIRDEVADLAVAIASKVIGQVMDEKHQRELVDSFMDDEMHNRQNLSQTGGDR